MNRSYFAANAQAITTDVKSQRWLTICSCLTYECRFIKRKVQIISDIRKIIQNFWKEQKKKK